MVGTIEEGEPVSRGRDGKVAYDWKERQGVGGWVYRSEGSVLAD